MELEKLKVIKSKKIRRMEEDNTRKKRWNALQMLTLEEAATAVEEKSTELKRELEKRDLPDEVKDIFNAVTCKSANEGINNNLIERVKKNTSLENEGRLIVDK